MNNDRRKALRAILDDLDKAENMLSDVFDAVQIVRDEEQDAFDNMPESLQEGERGQAMSEAIEALDEVAFDQEINDARDAILRALGEG